MQKFFRVALVMVLAFSVCTTYAQQKKKAVAKKTTSAARPKPAVKKVIKPTAAVVQDSLPAGVRIKITTSLGEMTVRLSDKTPKHRDNFIKLVKEHFYDSLLFHRVINGFMIQGGDPQSKNAAVGAMLGMGDIGYTIPAEFDSTLYHKKGALCAARTNNPEKASSGCQFYLVQGRLVGDGELGMIENQKGFKYSPAQRMTYKMNGGTPGLDRDYTVFGEIEKGMEVIDKIALVPRDGNNRPLTDVTMKMEVMDAAQLK